MVTSVVHMALCLADIRQRTAQRRGSGPHHLSAGAKKNRSCSACGSFFGLRSHLNEVHVNSNAPGLMCGAAIHGVTEESDGWVKGFGCCFCFMAEQMAACVLPLLQKDIGHFLSPNLDADLLMKRPFHSSPQSGGFIFLQKKGNNDVVSVIMAY